MQIHFQSWHKATNIASIDITLMSLLQYLDTFWSTLCTWRVRSSRPKEFFKKGVLKNFTTFTGEHLNQSLFCNKAAGWRPNVCEGVPLKNKILTRVSFCKSLGFHYKWNRQLFYYEGTSPYIFFKILEPVNRVIFQNSSELLLLNLPQQTKSCLKVH